jgi:hypothetical protein
MPDQAAILQQVELFLSLPTKKKRLGLAVNTQNHLVSRRTNSARVGLLQNDEF